MNQPRFARTLSPNALIAAAALVGIYLAPHTVHEAKSQGYALELTATSLNVNRPDVPVRINLMRWSTINELDAVAMAWVAPEAVATPDAEGGRAGFGGRGRGRGGGASAPSPLAPIDAVTTTIQHGPTIGYLWTDSASGYSLKHAVRSQLPNGGERIVLTVDRRLDAHGSDWTPTNSHEPTDYEFTLIELRIDAEGAGEGRTSLTTEIVLDEETGVLVLDGYAAAPVIFSSIGIARDE